MKIHIVQKGDTLWKIAKKYGVNFEELKKLNSQLSNPDMIMPGMKIKVPTAGGSIKKEGAINLGAKKEVPLKEHPFAKEKPVPIKEMPIKEMPVKEIPIKEMPIKEVPKVPYTPKMPLQVVPEIDINKHYQVSMQKMAVKEQPNLPPKPVNILPEVKEVPKKEIPFPAPVAPVQEMPQDYCVPMTPVMPGPGFCPPYGGFPAGPYMPYAGGPGMPMAPGMVGGPGMPMDPGMAGYAGMPMAPGMAGFPGMAGVPGAVGPAGYPAAAGPGYMPYHYDDESSAFMPHMPAVNPGYNPGAVMGAQNPGFNPAMQTTYMDPSAFGQMPTGYSQMPAGYSHAPVGYGQVPAGYGQAPGGYGQMPMDYSQMPGGYGQMPMEYGQMPAGYGQRPGGYGPAPAGVPQQGGYPAGMEFGPSMPAAPETTLGGQAPSVPYGAGAPYGQLPYGYPQMSGPAPQVMGAMDFPSSADMVQGATAPFLQNPAQGLPVGTGALDDCGCGAPAEEPAPQAFVPPTPLIYSAPYTAPLNVAQPPFMNPYGMGPAGYGMTGFPDESS
ncbi:SafA/ExsA family spore coat assembly protein [Neobacillus sp. 114]|uniref:SafA/ExsA family spore coat assembly protein n=1 Tax=Neobacillus sp. 114 TaxID=3048535 RepID=UPI0024C383DF|nr:SafA/ExsA family spore coat assembly protein [Neobacillus sp. 114]